MGVNIVAVAGNKLEWIFPEPHYFLGSNLKFGVNVLREILTDLKFVKFLLRFYHFLKCCQIAWLML